MLQKSSESATITITEIRTKEGFSEKSKKDYEGFFLTGKTTDDSGFKSLLPVEFAHFINKGQSRPTFEVGQKITIGIDSLDVDKWLVKIRKGSIL